MSERTTARTSDNTPLPSSFRDPSGRVFIENGILKRGIAFSYKESLDALMHSGLYRELVEEGLLVPHEEESNPGAEWHAVLRPRVLPFISYPYEWSFSAYKEAALATLAIHKKALARGLILKDASAYNIQWMDGKPALIDLLSFEPYREGEPWVAYRQFCQHFLAPLALMSKTDIRLSRLMALHIDGIPLDLASALLPKRTWLNMGLLSHIHLHARAQRTYAAQGARSKHGALSKERQLVVIEHLIGVVRKLTLPSVKTEWGDYYSETNYTEESFGVKEAEVRRLAASIAPATVWDMGGNDGTFASAIAQDGPRLVVSFDIDPLAVEKGYAKVRVKYAKNILPLVLDLTNPSPAIGWANRERESLAQRGPTDLALALALIHHLAISNNLPFKEIADFFAEICSALIIEFVPKEDSQVQRLLSSRKDIFNEYDEANFKRAFAHRFDILEAVPVSGSKRTLYLMKKK